MGERVTKLKEHLDSDSTFMTNWEWGDEKGKATNCTLTSATQSVLTSSSESAALG